MRVIVLSEDNFDEEVRKTDKKVLVDFYADWCGPCKMMAPAIEKIAEEVAEYAKVGKVNVDDCPEIAEEFGRYLGYGLANIAAVADPAVFVIGGGVSKAGEVLLPYIQKPYKERAFFANRDVEFALATLGNDAGICGAAKLVLGE